MKQLIRNLIDRLPYIKSLRQKVNAQGAFPAGHYYSPIPTEEEVLTYIERRNLSKIELLGIELNEQSQIELLNDYVQYYNDLSFPEIKTTDFRFYYKNDFFSYSDAIFLYCFLRKHKPKRIIEIGSGFSSAVILDTIDRFFLEHPEITFIDPDTSRLDNLLKSSDKEYVTVIAKKIQDVSPTIFSSLESGDLLFIDSSHVVKCGGELQLLMFEVLPFLPSGIFVHFHDVFYPFDYPSEWLIQGIFWNENYFLRAFLSYNCEWNIYFFNTYVAYLFEDFISAKMPLCIQNSGGSLYIQRR
jgi:hypothetical protein